MGPPFYATAQSFSNEMSPDTTLQKVLPHSDEAERCILGSIILDNKALHPAQEMLLPDDFFRRQHRAIYVAMLELYEAGSAIDPITIKHHLIGEEDADRDQLMYLANLTDGMPRSRNIAHYVKIVKDHSTRRALAIAGARIENIGYDADMDATEALEEAQKHVFNIAEGAVHTGFVHVREIAIPALERLEKVQDNREITTGVATGFHRIDELTAGLQPTDLIVVGARPGQGKTAFALNIAAHAAITRGKTVGIFSLEMSKDQLFFRFLCAHASVDAHRMRTGQLGKDEWERIIKAFEALSAAEIYIDDTAALPIMEMRAKARRMKAEHGLDLLVVDYLQLMRGHGRRGENRQQEVAEISRSLKALAKELQIPILALSQLSRAPEQRSGENRRPQLSDLRESGAVEQDSDVVMFIYREEVYKKTEENVGDAQIIIEKQRNGPTGIVHLRFLRQFTRFENPMFRQEES